MGAQGGGLEGAKSIRCIRKHVINKNNIRYKIFFFFGGGYILMELLKKFEDLFKI